MASKNYKDLFEFHGGLHLKNSVLWFDATTSRQLCFISNANVIHALDHQKILATDRTADMLHALAATHGRGRRVHEPQALVTPYCRPFSLGQLSLELFPSGYVLGSASLKIEYQDQTIVYAGDINARKNPLVERLEARRCDVLTMPCRFGQRRFIFPPFEQVAQSIVRFASDAIERGSTPVFFCTPCGEAQEVATLLLHAGITVRAHRKIYTVSQVYEQVGAMPRGLRRFKGATKDEGGLDAVIWPVVLRNSPSLQKVINPTTAFVSGMAMDEEARGMMNCDTSFVLSSHADYSGLLEYVRACEPQHVVLTNGSANEFKEDLEALGMEVSIITSPRQMDLF